MEVIAFDVEQFHLGVADFDALLVGSRIERALHLQTRLCRRGADQFDDGEAIRERAATPVLRNVAEHTI